MLDANNSFRLRRRELIFAICPPTSCTISDIFKGREKVLYSYNSILFSHLYILSVSEKVISLMCNILWVGYPSFKLKSFYWRQGSEIENQSQKYKKVRKYFKTISNLKVRSFHLV